MAYNVPSKSFKKNVKKINKDSDIEIYKGILQKQNRGLRVFSASVVT